MTKRSLFLILSLALSLTFLLTACQKTQTTPTEQNTAPIASSTQGEKPETTPTVSDLPTAENTDGAQPSMARVEPTQTSDNKTTPTANLITREEAKAKALTHAGLTDVTLRRIETDLDRERGVTVYEVDFEHDGYDYEYVLNAETGEILFHEKERDWD